MANTDAIQVQAVPATASQKAKPMVQVSPSMKGPEVPPQYS